MRTYRGSRRGLISGGMQPCLKQGAHTGETKVIAAMPQGSRYEPIKAAGMNHSRQ